MTEKTIKSKQRVIEQGEVFTPVRTVQVMLDQPELIAEINDLTATFLEPSAGEGAFLVEILKRRFKVIGNQSHDVKEFNDNTLIALSTLYGIEYLEDNVEMLVMNMITTFIEEYTKRVVQQFGTQPNQKVIKSAKVIIKANMAQGDALKRVTSQGQPIIFSEWRDITGRNHKVQRMEYTFDAIVNGGKPNDTVRGNLAEKVEQLSLFSLEDTQLGQENGGLDKHYVLVRWTDIYQQKVE